MTERERWIVYPLLFMSLGITLRGKFAAELPVDRIRCRELDVVGADDRTMVRIAANESGGYVKANRLLREPTPRPVKSSTDQPTPPVVPPSPTGKEPGEFPSK